MFSTWISLRFCRLVKVWFKHILLPVILTINIQMNMYRHGSLYRQRGLATSSANLDSVIPLKW